jgi:hypothetical protein
MWRICHIPAAKLRALWMDLKTQGGYFLRSISERFLLNISNFLRIPKENCR